MRRTSGGSSGGFSRNGESCSENDRELGGAKDVRRGSASGGLSRHGQSGSEENGELGGGDLIVASVGTVRAS